MFEQYTKDETVKKALSLLKNHDIGYVFDNLDKCNTRIGFYNLLTLDFTYSNVHAITLNKTNNSKVILISNKYKSSCLESIASIIAHESTHVLRKSTLKEELEATCNEIDTWDILKSKTYKTCRLTNRLCRLSSIIEENGIEGIEAYIKSISTYKNL